jgi:hypothetical protein
MGAKVLLEKGEQSSVIGERQVRMHSALEQHGRSADINEFLNFGQQLLIAEQERLRVARFTMECAEVTLGGTDVAVIDIPVHHVCDHLRIGDLETFLVGALAEIREVIPVKQTESFFG